MAEATQYNFPLKEVAELLIRKAGATEGLWTIGVNFTIGAGAVGPDAEHVRPSAFVGVDQLTLTKASEPGPLTFDAATLSANT
jgi:hypothetical protein